MEEILKNIYSESESFVLENNGSADASSVVGDTGSGGVMMNGSENENKTEEEVWRVLETGGGSGRGSGEPTMTLEDFLAKAGAVSVEDVKVSAVETMAPLPATAAIGMEAQFAPAMEGSPWSLGMGW
ncbi:G-box-binding factor 4-like [Forsythia ovata]|uniref:G-box-binding factor 4-like n=1 Tax=Forsythia ovata TaxID=205694 RepID=A0ABD1TMR6_9LAMI